MFLVELFLCVCPITVATPTLNTTFSVGSHFGSPASRAVSTRGRQAKKRVAGPGARAHGGMHVTERTWSRRSLSLVVSLSLSSLTIELCDLP